MTRVVQILARKSVPSETAVCLSACGTSRIQAFNWRDSQHLRQSCKTRMIHVFTPQIWDSNSPQNSKSSIFNFFRTKTTPQIGRKNPQFARKNPQTGANQDFCPDVLWQNVFYRSKARFKWQIGSATRRHTNRLIADYIAVTILGMLFNTLNGSDSSSWGPVLRLRRGYRSAFQFLRWFSLSWPSDWGWGGWQDEDHIGRCSRLSRSECHHLLFI